MNNLKTLACAVLAAAGLAVAMTSTQAATASADSGDFLITREVPTLDDLNAQVRFLVETPASDEAKAANLEGGMNAVVVPRTVYNLGLFRAPKGWNEVTGPETHNGNEHTATLHSNSTGRPGIVMKVTWKRVDGAWKMANSSLCEGVKVVGLAIPCTF
ncbi:hypothetical protein [Nocardia mexicana]|uniref:Low molecular weight antigen MTB12-like C-terminal domain-containing protein n=1 Tax=Nocardia mexicana TaxID=279262 RepID=A0A370HF04_9NOCA|nr:hypothetical protein [Nocardia mexicana]RDI55300.1 hypothetical protein DFR68_101133 [Nocardia mexicana]